MKSADKTAVSCSSRHWNSLHAIVDKKIKSEHWFIAGILYGFLLKYAGNCQNDIPGIIYSCNHGTVNNAIFGGAQVNTMKPITRKHITAHKRNVYFCIPQCEASQ